MGQLFGRGTVWSGSHIRTFSWSNVADPSGFIVDHGARRHSRDLGHDLSPSG